MNIKIETRLSKYWSKCIAILLLCVLTISICQITIFAAEPETVRVGVFPLGNFFYYDQLDNESGYYPDYIKKVCEYTRWNVEYVAVDNWKEAVAGLDAGNIDLIAPAQRTPEREEKYLFSGYSMSTELGAILTLPERDDLIYDDFETLSTLHYGAILESPITNAFIEKYAKLAGFTPNITLYNDSTALMAALNNREVDAAAMNIMFSSNDVKMIGRFSPAPVFFLSKTDAKSEKIMAELDNAMTAIRLDEPTFDNALFCEYFTGFVNNQFTKEEVAYIADHPEITVGLIANQPPLSFVDEHGDICGINKDLAELISKECGIKFHYEFLDIGQSGFEFLSNSDAKMVAGIMESDFFHPNARLLVSNTVLDTNFILVAREGEKFDPNMQAVMALPKNYIADETALNKKFPNFTFIKCDDITDSLNCIVSGKADFMMQNRYVLQEVLRNPRYTSLSIIDAYQIEENMKFVMLQGNEILYSIINKSIAAIKADDTNQVIVNNTIARVYRQSLSDTLYVYRVPLIVTLCLFVLLLIMAFLLVISKQRNLKRMEMKNGQLNDAVVRADKANEAKTEFLSKMSHDLRTPLNGILGISSLLKDRTDPVEIRADVEQIEISGKYLLTLINDTLDMSKIEAGKMEIHPAPVKSAQLFNNIITNAKVLAAEKGVQLQLDFEPVTQGKWKVIVTDGARVEQIFTNILSNAIKYTNPGGTVTISRNVLSTSDHTITVCYSVADTGVGMSQEFQKHLFEPFMQEGKINTTGQVGTGLGLAIVKELISMLGGTLDIKSEPNVGTVVTFNLEFEGYQGELDDVQDDKTAIDFNLLENKRILLCEDHPLNHEIAARLLEKKGMLVDWAENGQIGLEMFQKSVEGYYDAVLMDIRMPVMNGIDAAKRIRALDRSDAATIPIIAMTANAFDDDREETKQAGMNAHLAKPFELQQLYAVLYSFLK